MSNTLKFGAGKWAAKAGSVLAYNDLNNNFKPLPFTFTRASSATRVNESGLIESVASGVPRIDFLDNADGHLLLEPSRTNLALYSEDLSNAAWTKLNTTVTSNSETSPSGTTSADSLIEQATSSNHISFQNHSITSGLTYTFSVYAKYNGRLLQINSSSSLFGNFSYANFDLQNGILGTIGSAASAKITSFGNGWYLCSITSVATSSGSGGMAVALVTSTTSARNESYLGDGTSGVYLWGAQAEAGSYATSYIPTSGSSVTRAIDAASQTPPSGVIGQTEGTLYFEGTSNVIGDSTNLINFNYSSNSVGIIRTNLNAIRGFVALSGPDITFTSSPISGEFKAAIAYKDGDSAFYVNGVQVGTSSTSFSFGATLSEIYLGAGISYFAVSNQSECKQALVFNTRLSNADLATLTSL